MEQTDCSETSAYKLQTPGNYPKESIQQLLPVEIINYAHDITSDKVRGRKHSYSFSSIVILCYIKDYNIRTYSCTEALHTKILISTNSSLCMHLYLINTVNAKLHNGNFVLLIMSRLYIITSVSGAHPASYTMVTGSSLPRVQWSGREPDHSSQSSAEFKNHWIYVSTPHMPLCREQGRICLFLVANTTEW